MDLNFLETIENSIVIVNNSKTVDEAVFYLMKSQYDSKYVEPIRLYRWNFRIINLNNIYTKKVSINDQEKVSFYRKIHGLDIFLPVVVVYETSEQYRLLDGNHRVDALRQDGFSHVLSFCGKIHR